MKRAAMMLAVSLAISMVVGACASMQPGGRDLVAKAVSAQGGADALTAVKTISYKATVRQWDPEQSAVAGGEMRLGNDSTVVTVTDVAAGATRNDWVRNFQYPAPRTFTSAYRHPGRLLEGSTATAAPSRAARRTRRPIRCRACASPRSSASCSPPPPCWCSTCRRARTA